MKVLGIMTGTSCDGLDAACIEISGSGANQGWKPLWNATAPYPAKLRKRVLEIQRGKPVPLRTSLELSADLGDWYASTAAQMIQKNSAPDLIANHGQTVAHHPDIGMTLQLGEPTRIAQATGISTAAFFRDGDLAAGGQGAPLVPRFHQLLARGLDPRGAGIAIHNIGGVSNLTYVGSGQTLAFDTGPGNFWIDAAAELATRGKLRMDRDGKLGARGTADFKALTKILKHRYFKLKAPKSTGRDDFPFKLLTQATRVRGNDLVATATAVTVDSIGEAYEREVLGRGLPLQTVYICGGGARNPTLMQALQARMGSIQVLPLENEQFIEAQAFAYFGYLSVRGESIGGPWTGAPEGAPPAHLIPGRNWKALLSQL